MEAEVAAEVEEGVVEEDSVPWGKWQMVEAGEEAKEVVPQLVGHREVAAAAVVVEADEDEMLTWKCYMGADTCSQRVAADAAHDRNSALQEPAIPLLGPHQGHYCSQSLEGFASIDSRLDGNDEYTGFQKRDSTSICIDRTPFAQQISNLEPKLFLFASHLGSLVLSLICVNHLCPAPRQFHAQPTRP